MNLVITYSLDNQKFILFTACHWKNIFPYILLHIQNQADSELFLGWLGWNICSILSNKHYLVLIYNTNKIVYLHTHTHTKLYEKHLFFGAFCRIQHQQILLFFTFRNYITHIYTSKQVKGVCVGKGGFLCRLSLLRHKRHGLHRQQGWQFLYQNTTNMLIMKFSYQEAINLFVR